MGENTLSILRIRWINDVKVFILVISYRTVQAFIQNTVEGGIYREREGPGDGSSLAGSMGSAPVWIWGFRPQKL